MLTVAFFCLLLAPVLARAQLPPKIPPGGLLQLQVAQPEVDLTTPVTATATFDPPVVRAGETTFYRVTVGGTESSIQWPSEIAVPAGLRLSRVAHGQLTEFWGNKYRPFTSFVYETRPSSSGNFTVTNFSVDVYGKPIEIPAASLKVVGAGAPLPAGSAAAPRKLVMEISQTNLFVGEPFRVSVMLPAGPGNQIEALREIQLNGNGLMTDRLATRQAIQEVKINGQLKPAFVCEMVATPIAAGSLKFSAQAFTAGREFGGSIAIHGPVVIAGGSPQYILLVSDTAKINVQPLPSAGELPGFTGAIGQFFCDPPQLSTNRLRVGEPAHLKVVFHNVGDLSRLTLPQTPRSPDWQIIPDNPPSTGYTLIPLTDEPRETPAIPFSYFNPATKKYVDLTVPPVPVTVVGNSLPVQLPSFGDETKPGAPLKLSGLAPTPGWTVASLKPLQSRGWFVGVQLAPVIGFVALWQWDRRRRFLEAHPEIVRRRRARRALRRERVKLQKAAAAGDAAAFVAHAANAMKISCAPREAANPRALVCADVLAQLDGADQTGRAGETVRAIFAAADAQFAASSQIHAGCLALKSDVDTVLQKLEEKL